MQVGLAALLGQILKHITNSGNFHFRIVTILRVYYSARFVHFAAPHHTIYLKTRVMHLSHIWHAQLEAAGHHA
jgi:hypothetical protein